MRVLLDNPEDASLNSLHVNNYGYFTDKYYPNYATSPVTDKVLNADMTSAIDNMVDPEKEHLWSDLEFIGEDGDYNVYVTKMQGKLQPGESTLPFLRQVYMDSHVTQCVVEGCNVEGNHYVLQGGTHYNGSWNVVVEAYAIQDAGFADVNAAYAAYDGE